MTKRPTPVKKAARPVEPQLVRPRNFEDLRRLLTTNPWWALLVPRLFLGVTFTYAGLQKMADPNFFDAAKPGSIQRQLAGVRAASPLNFMLGLVAHHAVLFGWAIAFTELAVGLATLLGLWQRIAAAVGVLVSLSFFLTISWVIKPYYYGSDIVFVFLWAPLALVGTGGVLSLDGWRTGRVGRAPVGQRVDQQRRAVLSTAALGGAVVVLATTDASTGRAIRSRREAGALGAGEQPTTTLSGGSPAATSSGSQAPGVAIGTTSQVAVGDALPFNDPVSGAPAFVVQPSAGQFKAFSAVCTHAGCTVAYVKGAKQFQCPCHGGIYDGASGAVVSGPPPAPLNAIQVEVVGDQIEVPKS